MKQVAKMRIMEESSRF